ncbi:hypothetical protein EON80_09490 [bacterium]|nr:MAG: hypothetical protein EON80_09490 [bacterium]
MSTTPPILSHELHRSLQLQLPGEAEPRWRYPYGGKPKPFFHPLRTPAGHCVTLYEPHDHVWHRGLWFTIKYINGENFWEERVPFGTQQIEVPPTVIHGIDGGIKWDSEISWERPDDAGEVFVEHRQICYRAIESSAYVLDWDIELTAQSDLLLDRTPFTTWGGYGGLTLRGNRNWQETRLLFSDGSTSDRPTGILAQWCDLSGKFDGGEDQSGGIAIFDHPENLRAPSPWYGGTGSGHYFNAAFLFHKPLQVAAEQQLHFRYRVLVHDEIWDVERLQNAYTDYVSTSSF